MTLENLIGLTAITAMIAQYAIYFVIIGILFYVYYSITLMTIAKKIGDKRPWLAWIPLANIALFLKIGDFHWAWAFLALISAIPVIGIIPFIALIVLTVIAQWRVNEKRNFPGWTSLLTLLPWVGGIWNIILMGILAWKKD